MKNLNRIVLFTALVMLWAASAVAQNDDLNIPYQMPPDDVAAIVDAPATPGVSLSPDRSVMVLMERPGLPTIEDLAQPELRLAGIRINPNTFGGSRGSYFTGLQIVDIETNEVRNVEGLPENARINNVSWSPDGYSFAFTHTAENGIELWFADTQLARARRMGGVHLNDAFYGASFVWHPNGTGIYARILDDPRPEAPEAPLAPAGPIIQENLGRSAPARTYQDLLQNAHDEELFDHYFTSQIVFINFRGTATFLGEPGIFRTISPSPDGEYLMVSRVQRPYSYTVPAFRFPLRTEIWDQEGNKVHLAADIPLQDEIPIGFGATSIGPRSITWRNDAPSTLVWVEAQDEGNPRKDVEIRDIVYQLDAPFDGEKSELAKLSDRYAGIMWGDDDLALVMERWFSTRSEKVWHVSPGSPDREQRLVMERNFEDVYNDPGSPQMRVNESGFSVLMTSEDGGSIFLSGQGASPDGNFPFLDRFELASGDTERLWQSESPYYEQVVSLLDGNAERIITRRQQTDVPPNFFLRDLNSNSISAITDFEHPTPDLKDVHRELITYEREDGLPMSGVLYLPPGYDKENDGPLPMVIWAYPREFRSMDAAGQRSDSPYSFNNISYWGPQWLVTQGYAVLANATMPIVGEGDKEPNDTFIEQLIMNAEAAVNVMAELGVGDPDRAAIGGHSYGAFMTANLLAHSDIFRAGIARSGAYNRSLTPFGFQREERTIWDDTDLYIRMSPFFHAHTLTTPILFIHGEADNNSGTFPMQSERLYQAIQGLGGTARLVMLPHESHGYRARESVMHMLWETLSWLDTYVKYAEDVTAGR